MNIAPILWVLIALACLYFSGIILHALIWLFMVSYHFLGLLSIVVLIIGYYAGWSNMIMMPTWIVFIFSFLAFLHYDL